jgi:Trp operon repressor
VKRSVHAARGAALATITRSDAMVESAGPRFAVRDHAS